VRGREYEGRRRSCYRFFERKVLCSLRFGLQGLGRVCTGLWVTGVCGVLWVFSPVGATDGCSVEYDSVE